MLSFEKLEIRHIELLLKYLSNETFDTCDYTPTGLMMWRNYFNVRIAEQDGALFIMNQYRNIGTAFSLPVCKNRASYTHALDKLSEYALYHKIPIRFCTVPEAYINILSKYLGEQSTIITDEAWYDYVYDADSFSSLIGRKYNGQRNHINKFKREHDGYKFTEISSVNIQKAREFCEAFCDLTVQEPDMRETEARATVELFDYYEKAGLVGGYLEYNDTILAIAIGEIIGNTMFQHIEKALPDINGAYQTIAYEFSNHFATGCRYINREEDEGIPGLRKAKLAIHPEKILKKYVINK